MTDLNDHTDAELARRQHLAEMGEPTADERRWLAFCRDCERMIGVASLDGDEAIDGFSLDSAHDAFTAGMTARAYALRHGCRPMTAPLTSARLTIITSARHYPPSAWVVSPTGGRNGLEAVAWKRNCAWLVDAGYLRPNAHGDFYLTDLGEATKAAADEKRGL